MIQVENLRKTFGPITAVAGISFSAQQGDVLGFLGPNGAGKTTAMRMLTGYLTPDSGSAKICGHDILHASVKVRQSLGYLAEHAPAYNEMTVASFLNFICDARQIRGAQRKDALDRVIDVCAIESVYHQTIDTLSKGYRRRVGLAQALVHNPPVLILDEPTDGLDPNQKHEVRQLINAIAKEKCIIVSTHILEEVDAVCSRMIIVANGRILVDSTPDALKREHQADLFDIFRTITQAQLNGKRSQRNK